MLGEPQMCQPTKILATITGTGAAREHRKEQSFATTIFLGLCMHAN
jgi:hypothetical protein